MACQQDSALPGEVCYWTNDSGSVPAWVTARMIGGTASNGSFLLDTPAGTARVHKGHVVIGYGGDVWTRPPEEVARFIAGLREENRPAEPAIGPGKSARAGIGRKSRRGSARGSGRKRSFHPAVGRMPSIEWVLTPELSVDLSYQRSIDNAGSRRLIARIAAGFDWRLCMPLVVSRRADGSDVIIDGQHRWAAAMLRGDIPQLPCCRFTYASPEEEARMFILANRARKPINRLDDFYAALVAGDEDAHEIRRLVTEAGLRMARNTSSSAWKPGEVAFTSSIATALRRHGEVVVSEVLTCLAEAFKEQALIQGASLFGALVRIFVRSPEGFDPDKLDRALRTRSVTEWGQFVHDQRGGDARTTVMEVEILKAMARVDEKPVAA